MPIPAVPGHDDGPPILDTAMTVGGSFVRQAGVVSVTLNVKSSVAVTNVSPSDLSVGGGDATCTGPSPAIANVPAGGAGVNFVWSCTPADLGEYVFSAGADDAAGTTSWPSATSASVLSAPSGGPNVVTWNLGSTTAPVPGETLTSGYTAGRLRLPGRRPDHVPEVRHRHRRLDGRARTPRARSSRAARSRPTAPGRSTPSAVTTTQAFWAYDVATDTWTAQGQHRTRTSTEGGALVYLNVGGTKYVFATMGERQRGFKRYDVAANTWTAMANAPNNVKKGGALTTDGTNIYALRGDNHKEFFRYNVAANTWTTTLAPTCRTTSPGAAASPTSAASIYALSGNGKKNFYRYDIAANTLDGPARPHDAGQRGGRRRADQRRHLHLRVPGQDQRLLALRHRRQHVDGRWLRSSWPPTRAAPWSSFPALLRRGSSPR